MPSSTEQSRVVKIEVSEEHAHFLAAALAEIVGDEFDQGVENVADVVLGLSHDQATFEDYCERMEIQTSRLVVALRELLQRLHEEENRNA